MTQAPLTLRGLDRDELAVLGRNLKGQFREDDVPSLAAGVAFRIFLSFFPATFAAVAAYSLVASGQDIVVLLERMEFLPGPVRQQIEQPMVGFVEQAGGGATLTVLAGILGGLWAASSAAVMFSKALTRIYGSSESRRFVELRAVGVVIALAIFLALVALVVLLVAGRVWQRRILDVLALEPGLETLATWAMTVGRFALAVVVLAVLFAFVYWVGPDRTARPRFQWLTPGGFFSVVGWVALSALLGLYTRIAGENEIYGALGGVIVLLLWLQLSMVALLVGAELNAELRRLVAARPDVGEGAGDSEWPASAARRPAPAPAPDGDGNRAKALAVGALSAAAAALAWRRRGR